ncbi:MAG: GAF domain-containing protein [Anaerolineales bacterium]|nr:GAF domain-containing protein [Anaerolineales bacterium]
MGCFYIFTLRPQMIPNENLVESFTFQVALALEKAEFAGNLELSEQQFRVIFEHAPDGYYISDLKGNMLDGNRAAERITGYNREELIGQNFLDVGLISKTQIPRATKLYAKILAGKSTGPIEMDLVRKDGTQVVVETSSHPVMVNNKTMVLGIIRDIAHRKEFEDNLEKAHGTLTRVLEGIDAHVYVADMNSYEILYMNKQMIEDYGGDFTGRLCYEIFRQEDGICSNCSNRHLVNNRGEPGEVFVWEGQNFKTKRWYRNYDRAIYWNDQRIVRMQIAVDVTDSRNSSKALELSEELYRNLFETSHNAIMTLSPPTWNFTSGNSAMVNMFGLAKEKQFLKYQPWELSPQYQPDGQLSDIKAQEMIRIAVETGSNFFHWTHKRVNGEEFPATVQLTRVDLEDNFFIQATVRDISTQLNAEKVLKQQMDDLALINTLNVAANQGQSLEEIISTLSGETKRVFQCNNTAVYLLSEDQSRLSIYLHSLENSFREQIEKIIGIDIPNILEMSLEKDSVYKDIIQHGEARILSTPKIIQDMMRDFLGSTFLPEILKKGIFKLIPQIYKLSGVKNVAIAPLITSNRLVGLIDISSPNILIEQDKDRLIIIADQLSGIIKRIRTENKQDLNLREIELMYTTLVENSRINDVDEICKHLAEKVREANPDTYVMVTLYDPEVDAIRVRALEGLGNKAERLFKLIGKRPEDFKVKAAEQGIDQEINALSTSGKLELIPNGLYDLTRGVIPKSICKSAERMMGVEKVYIAGFGLGKTSIGGLVFFVKQGGQINFPTAIETIVNHIAVIFERRMAQEEVLQRKVQLEALRDVELEIVSQLNLEQLLSSIAEKANLMVNASAAGFYVLNPERDVLEYLAYVGFDELPDNTDMTYGEGLSGKVWQTRKTIIVENYAEWEGRSEPWETISDYYLAGIPVSWGDEVLGVLEIAKDSSTTLSPSELEMLELFATQAAIAIKNAKLFNEEKQRRQEAEILSDVGMKINSMMDRAELLDMILGALQSVVPYDSASIQLVHGSDIVVEAFRGTEHPGQVIGTTYTIEENVLAHPILFEGKNVILKNRDDIEHWLEGPETADVKSWIGVPLEIKGTRIGILTLDHYSADKYTEHHADLALDFANQAALALENNRLFEEIRHRTREIEAVYESALDLTKELQPEALFEYLYSQVDDLFSPDAFILATVDPSSDMIQVSYATEVGVRQTKFEGLQISPDQKNSLLSWIIRKKTPLLIGNVETDSLPIQPQQSGKIIRSLLGVPLLVGDRLIGALVVQSYQAQAYTHDHRRLLQLLGNQAAIALENSRLFDDAQKRLMRLSSLREIDQAISGSVDLEITMEVLIQQLTTTLDVDAACVLAYKPAQHTLVYVNSRGFRTKSLQFTSLKLGQGLAGKAALERTLVHIPDLNAQVTSLDESPHFRKEQFVTYLAHPLIAKGELVGVLEVFNRTQLDPDPEWINFLDALARMAAIAIDRLNLYNGLARSNIEIKQAYEATIEGWARAVELRDGDTEGHSRRVVSLLMNLARAMGIKGEELSHMRHGALLHDIGKMAVPDGILLKAGKLTDEEWLVMKKHPVHAYDMLSQIDYLRLALDIPYCHHERWDGTGYPQGLTGEDIPLAARIFAIVDVWDALQSDRPYRDAWTKKKAIEYLNEQSGLHFDPTVVQAFFDLIGES